MSNAAQSKRTTDEHERRIERDMERLRVSTHPALRRAGELVADQGVDIGTSLVANLMPEDVSMLSGVIVTVDGRVHEFEYDWRGTQPDQGRLAVWREITASYETRAFRGPISIAASLVRRTGDAAAT